MEFSEKLKKLRNEKNVSQQELADSIYVSRSAVAKWENGLGLPCAESLGLLADYFGVTRDELVKENDSQSVSKNRMIFKYKKWLIIAIAAASALLILLITGLSLYFSGVLRTTPNRSDRFEPPKDFPMIIVEGVSGDQFRFTKGNPNTVFTMPEKEAAASLPSLPYQSVYSISLPEFGTLSSVRYYYLDENYEHVEKPKTDAANENVSLSAFSPVFMWWSYHISDTADLFPERDEVQVHFEDTDASYAILIFTYLYGYEAEAYFIVDLR